MNYVKLNNIAVVSSGQGAPQGNNSYGTTGTPFIKAGNLEDLLTTKDEYKSCGLVSQNVAHKYKLKEYPVDTIVFAKSGMSAMKGRVYCLNNIAYVVNHLATIIPNKEKVKPRYLKYFFQKFSPTNLIKDRAYPSIRLEDISNIQVYLPSIEEQQIIIDGLDQADSLRQKRKQAINLLDKYLKSVFVKMFEEDTTIWKTLKEISTFIDYRGKTPTKTSSGIRLITAKNVRDGYLEFQPEEFIAESDYLSWMRRGFPKEGDILFTTEAPLGNTAILPKFDKLAFAQRIIIIQPLKLIKSEFLLFALSTPKVRSDINRRSTGSTVKGIRSKELVNVKIPIPDMQKQEKFVEIYRSCIKLKNKMHEQSSELDNQFNALMQKHFNSN